MPDPFNGYLYLKHLRARWKVGLTAILAAAAISLAAGLLSPSKYTATVSLVIEPPAGGDPRAATAVSQIYLESLKTYEHYASSNELFSRAVQLFPLRGGARPTPIERLKREVLRVSVPRNTKIMEISATCGDPKLAHTVALYLAKETMQLNRNTTQAGGEELLASASRARDAAAASLRAAEAAYAAAAKRTPTPAAIRDQLTTFATKQDGLSRVALSLEFVSDDADGRSAQIEQRVQEQAVDLERRAAAMQAQLAVRSAEIEAASARLEEARSAFDQTGKRVREVEALQGLQGERLSILDPGIVPERRSSPNIPLNVLVGVATGGLLSLLYLTLDYGLREQHRQAAREESWMSSRV
jgi:uncharacterized protein involved in exopolysaccharide biosynthesis